MKNKNDAKEFIRQKFRELYQVRWKGQGKTAFDFAQAIDEIMPDSRCDEKYVSDWLNGRQTPVKYLPAICKVLDVDISEFSLYKFEDRYKYSREYADGLNEALQKIAIEKFGISLAFLHGLREIIPDFDEKYPKFTPIQYYGGYSNLKPYERRISAVSSYTSKESAIQIDTPEGKVFLTIHDFKVLRHLQKQVKGYIERCFELYKKEFQAAEDKLNIMYEDLWLKANPDYTSEDWFPVGVPKFSDKTIQEIDKFGIYTESERKKYGLPLKGPIFKEDNTDEYGNMIVKKADPDERKEDEKKHYIEKSIWDGGKFESRIKRDREEDNQVGMRPEED